MSKICGAIIFAISVFLSSNAYADCVLGNAGISLVREFSLPRNSVCVIKRTNAMAKMVGVKLAVPPKRGKFGSANIHELAYRAGDVPGDDYFEYISIESVGGKIQNFRIKNAVHITPQ